MTAAVRALVGANVARRVVDDVDVRFSNVASVVIGAVPSVLGVSPHIVVKYGSRQKRPQYDETLSPEVISIVTAAP